MVNSEKLNKSKNLGIDITSFDVSKQCGGKQEPSSVIKKIPNNRLLSALKESEDILSSKVIAKRYKSFDDLVKDVD